MRFLAQTKGRREKERERKRKGKEEEGKEKGKGEREREIGSEALAETEKNRKRPSRESKPEPQQTRLMLYHWATETSDTSPASLFEILSALPPLHNIGIIQCPQLTNPLRSGNPSRSPLCITHGLKECLGGSMVEHQPRLLGFRVRFPAGAFAIFSVSAKASLPISLSLSPFPFSFPSSSFPFLFLSLSFSLRPFVCAKNYASILYQCLNTREQEYYDMAHVKKRSTGSNSSSKRKTKRDKNKNLKTKQEKNSAKSTEGSGHVHVQRAQKCAWPFRNMATDRALRAVYGSNF